MTDVARTKRPGLVTLIGIIIYVQAVIAAVVAVMAFFNRDDSYWQTQTGQSADGLLTVAIVEAILAVILFLVAARLMAGARGARTLVAVVMVLRIAAGVWAMLAHHAGGIFGTAGITVLIALFVLWVLYGHDASEEYFGDR